LSVCVEAVTPFCVCWQQQKKNISVIAFFKLWNQSKMSMSRGMAAQKWPQPAATTCAPI